MPLNINHVQHSTPYSTVRRTGRVLYSRKVDAGVVDGKSKEGKTRNNVHLGIQITKHVSTVQISLQIFCMASRIHSYLDCTGTRSVHLIVTLIV